MMHVISVIGQKGGSGKTTVALGVAVAAARAGKTVAVLDADPQATAAQWGDRRLAAGRKAPIVTSCQAARLADTLDLARSHGADLVVIDTPGKSSDASIAAARVADLVLVPLRPQMWDLDTLRAVDDILGLAGNPPAAVVINHAPARGTRHLDATRCVGGLKFRVCPVVLYARAAHGDAGNIGLVAEEYQASGKAGQEMRQLYRYSRAAIEGGKKRGKSSSKQKHISSGA